MMGKTIIPLVRLDGVIAAGRGRGGGRTLSAQALAPALAKAFGIKKAPAVALVINSPGGSAAQSALIARRIRQLAAEKKKRVLVFVEDVAASGGYWLACAGDEIFVEATSIVGSIGVIGASFGFAGLLEKMGVERRVLTAGARKSQWDPFLPEKAEDVARFHRLLEALHQEFVGYVKERRGAMLKDVPNLFEGEIFTGREGVACGLADAVGDRFEVIKARFGDKAKFKAINAPQRSWIERLSGAGAEAVAEAIETRAAFARYGL